MDASGAASDSGASDASDTGAIDAAKPKDSSTVEACVPTALACDGKVHACNGVVDEGCPSAVSIGAAGSSQLLGGDTSSGTPFSDACPAGQVLIGVGGSTGQWMDSIYGICGTLQLHTSKATTPYTYAVTISAGATLPTRGTDGTTDTNWQVTCGADQAVVSVAGNSGLAMDHVILSCAPLLVTGSPGAFSLQQGSVTALPSQGDTSGGSPFTPVSCPSPQVIALISGTAAQWLNSLDVACATPSLSVIP
jgi:hypothetical protein